MEGCFIKKIFLNESDEKVHNQFVRFGKGDYLERAIISFTKVSKIKIKSSFEFANDFVKLVAGLVDILIIEGVILSKKDISEILSKYNIKGNSEAKKGGLFFKNNIEKQEINKEQLNELVDNSYFALLDIESKDRSIKLKTKKNLPKPGKSGEGKVNDKFCQLEADLKYWKEIKDYFFWDIGDYKKVKVSHEYIISELIYPKNIEKNDFEKIRLLTKRKGVLKRNIEIDKSSKQVKECEFEV